MRSTYLGNFRDNLPNLDGHTVQWHEGYRRTNPAYYWQIIEGFFLEVVMGYSGWKVVEEVPYEARLICYGLDFGFDPRPGRCRRHLLVQRRLHP